MKTRSHRSKSHPLDVSPFHGEPTKKVPTEPWTKTTPTDHGWYWHWNGDEDCAPLPTSVLWSPQGCFVSAGQLGFDQAIDCDKYGGWWLELKRPPTPNYLTTQFDSPLKASSKCVPIVLYFTSNADADEFIEMVKLAKLNMVSSKL